MRGGKGKQSIQPYNIPKVTPVSAWQHHMTPVSQHRATCSRATYPTQGLRVTPLVLHKPLSLTSFSHYSLQHPLNLLLLANRSGCLQHLQLFPLASLISDNLLKSRVIHFSNRRKALRERDLYNNSYLNTYKYLSVIQAVHITST